LKQPIEKKQQEHFYNR